MKRATLSLLLLAAACRLDYVERLDVDDPPIVIPLRVRTIPDQQVVTPEVVRLEQQLRGHLALLAGPYLGGRRPGSDGAAETVGYIVTTLDDAGVRPAASDGGWLQTVALRIRSTSGSLALIGGEGGAFETGVAVGRSSGSAAISRSLTVVDAGYGITAPEWGSDDYESLDAQGALVLVRAGAPEGSPPDTIYSTRIHKLERAGRAGASALLEATGVSVTDDRWAALARAVASPRVLEPGESAQGGGGVEVFGLLSSEVEAKLREALAAAETKVDLEVRTDVREIGDANVIGRIAGSERPEQSVLVVANWDAGGLSAPVPAGGGAESNATGVAVALAVASRLGEWARAGRRPRRSVVFVLTAADTLEHYGTRTYLTAAAPAPETVAAAVVLDGFELQDRRARLVSYGAERTSLDGTLHAVFGDRLQRDAAGSANDPPQRVRFDDAGITTIGFSRRSAVSALDDAAFDATVDLGEVAAETQALFDLVWQLASAPGMPTRVEPVAASLAAVAEEPTGPAGAQPGSDQP